MRLCHLPVGGILTHVFRRKQVEALGTAADDDPTLDRAPEVVLLFTAPEARGRGLATALLARCEALLSARFGSAVSDVTLALLVRVPCAVVVTTISTDAPPPLGMAPRLHVTTAADSLQVPWVGVAETKTTPPGRWSVRTTF